METKVKDSERWEAIGVDPKDVEGRPKEAEWSYFFKLAARLTRLCSPAELARIKVTEKNAAKLFSGLVGDDLVVTDLGGGLLRFSAKAFALRGKDTGFIDFKAAEFCVPVYVDVDADVTPGSFTDEKDEGAPVVVDESAGVLSYTCILYGMMNAPKARKTGRKSIFSPKRQGKAGAPRWSCYIARVGKTWDVYLSNEAEPVKFSTEEAAKAYVDRWLKDDGWIKSYPNCEIYHPSLGNPFMIIESGRRGDVLILGSALVTDDPPKVGGFLRGNVCFIDEDPGEQVTRLGVGEDAELYDESRGRKITAVSVEERYTVVASNDGGIKPFYRLKMEPKPRRAAPLKKGKRK